MDALVEAIKAGDVEKVRALLKDDPKLAAAKKNDLKRARELWTDIVKDPASPQGAQQRAQAMLNYYGPGEGK